MSCNSPLMTPDECVDFVDKYDWVPAQVFEESNPQLTAGYLRNNGIIARISKKAPISMFRIGQKSSVWVPREQEETAKRMIQELASRYTYCPQCGHVLLVDEEECSFCLETGTE